MAHPAIAQPGETPAVPASDARSQIDQVVAQLASPETKRLVLRTVERARRAIAIGPTVGGWGSYAPSPASGDAALGIGVGLEMFAVTSVPELGDLQELVVEKTKAKLQDKLAGGTLPDRAALEQLARAVYDETKAEVAAQMSAPPQTFEKPRFTLALEADRVFRADVWQARLRFGVGVGPVTLGATAAYGFGDESVHVGPELVGHALLSPGARTPVVDAFVRYDLEVAHRDTNTDMLVIGARFLLDAI